MSYTLTDDLRSTLQARLACFPVQPIEDPKLRLAAVAFTIVKCELTDEACFLLTWRPPGLKRHGGQFALPGGRLDEGETPVEAALRELDEELGLKLGTDSVMGRLDDYATRSGFRMTPIVVWGGEAVKLTPDPQEVARVHRVPLADLDNPKIPNLFPPHEDGAPVLSAPITTLNDLVYAPTAAILYQFREVALQGRDTRVAHFDQPRFAWK